ncbi:MAG: hypothetical protein ABFD53_08455 [Anaerolineaceae bacterium]
MEQGWLESGKKVQGVGRKMPLQNRSQNQKMPDRALRQNHTIQMKMTKFVRIKKCPTGH